MFELSIDQIKTILDFSNSNKLNSNSRSFISNFKSWINSEQAQKESPFDETKLIYWLIACTPLGEIEVEQIKIFTNFFKIDALATQAKLNDLCGREEINVGLKSAKLSKPSKRSASELLELFDKRLKYLRRLNHPIEIDGKRLEIIDLLYNFLTEASKNNMEFQDKEIIHKLFKMHPSREFSFDELEIAMCNILEIKLQLMKSFIWRCVSLGIIKQCGTSAFQYIKNSRKDEEKIIKDFYYRY